MHPTPSSCSQESPTSSSQCSQESPGPFIFFRDADCARMPCRSGFHRWDGLRHGWATMETKIIRGRWNPSRQSTLPVEVPPLDWPPTWVGHGGNEDHLWTMESLPTKYTAGRGSTAGMASDMVGPRWKRRSFVDDGIPPDKAPCRSGLHRWNGLRHG